MDVQQLQQALEKYKRQNDECRQRIYADFMVEEPHVHPVATALVGAVLGAIITTVIFLMRTT